MADRKENELTKANNFEYVRALDSNGNSIQISKSDLVSVLEELLGFPFSQKGDFKKGDNVDNFTESGIYAVNTLPDEDDSNTPINLGILLVFKSKINSAQGGSPILQIMYEYNGSKFLFRNFWDDQWFDWKEVNMQDLLL